MAFCSGLVAMVSYRYGLPYTATFVGLLVAGLAVLGVQLGLQRIYPQTRTPGVIRVVSDFQYKKQVATVALDAALIALAYYSAYVLRFEGRLEEELPVFSSSLLIVLVAHVATLGAFGIYLDSWRHAAIRDLVRLTGAIVTGTVLAMAVTMAGFRFAGHSAAVFAIHGLLATSFLGGSRVLFRALGELLVRDQPDGPATLIYGAGAGGVMVLREARSNGDLGWRVVGFIDDDRDKFRTNVHGVQVLGTLEQVAPMLASGQVAQVVVATATVPPERLETLARLCAESEVRTLVASLRFHDADFAESPPP
jgi:FlaA1/EpsC-like NDP-sugar epimerase